MAADGFLRVNKCAAGPAAAAEGGARAGASTACALAPLQRKGTRVRGQAQRHECARCRVCGDANESARAMPAPTRVAVLAPARASPSAAATGPAAHLFTRGNPSAAIPLAYPSSSAVRADAFSHLSAAGPGRAFAPLSATGLGFGQAGTAPEKYFRLN